MRHASVIAALSGLLALAGCDGLDFPAPREVSPDLDVPPAALGVAEAGLADESIAPICAPPSPDMAMAMFEALNAERLSNGKAPLAYSEKLAFAAQAHACDMAAMERLQVAGSTGASVVHRVRAVEYTACSSAQMVGGAGSASGQVGGWMGAIPSRETILHQKFDEVGAGVVSSGGRMWWSLVMADNCS